MSFAATVEETRPPQLRLWPGVAAVVLLCLVRFGAPAVLPEAGFIAIMGGLVGALLVLVWWLFFSRAPWSERLGALAVMAVVVAATQRIIDKSIATGAMGFLFWMYVIPALSIALVVWAVAARRFARGPRRAALLAAILLASGGWALLRTDGITGGGSSQLRWRWSPTAEQKLLARASVEPAAPAAAPAIAKTPVAEVPEEPPSPKAQAPAAVLATRTPFPQSVDWSGFRGPHRDSVIRGVRIKTDWAASPPAKLWSRPIGPGWSSFAVGGGLFYTQEQRGDYEVVACYKVTTGEPVWTHRDPARFWESNGGAGPRGTPTLSGGRVYTFGATGILNALDARDGAVLWTRNAASDTGAKTPGWGFASSPLVVDDLVIVAASGRLAAYDLATGNPRWQGPAAGTSYSSPQLMTVGGVAQVVMLSGTGATSVAPADGKVLWKYAWPGSIILQPALTADGDVLMTALGSAGGEGTRRLGVAQSPSGWTVAERWTSRGLKPYFNDFVVHKGYAFGFDGSILACIDLQDGQRKWKGGRYGNGQLLLLADQDVLLVLSEEGELALVAATPAQFTEIAHVPAIEGKTWNHPVLAGDFLLVRNGQEMAAFRLPRDGG